MTSADCVKEFCKLKTLFRRRHYIETEAVKTAFMCDKFGYVKLAKNSTMIGISKDGLIFSSPTGLLNEWAGALGKIPPIFALFLSLAALIVALYTRN